MGKKKSINIEKKNEIIKLFQQGETQTNTSIQISLSQPSGSNVIKEWKIKKCLTSHQVGAGLSKVTSPGSDRILCRIIDYERFSSISEYTDALRERGLEISRATFHRRMIALIYMSRAQQSKHLLNKKQRLKRLDWAKKYQTCDESFWSIVVFTDECSVALPMSINGNVWRQKMKNIVINAFDVP